MYDTDSGDEASGESLSNGNGTDRGRGVGSLVGSDPCCGALFEALRIVAPCLAPKVHPRLVFLLYYMRRFLGVKKIFC